MMKEVSDTRGHSILRAASFMGVATLMSRVLGLIREQVFAIMFGAGNFMDAFNVAFRIPNLLRDLFAEGAMSASLVPTFTRACAEEGERRGWRVAGLVFRVLFLSVSLLAVIGIFFAPELVSLYASAFKQIPGKFELTVRMTRIIFPFFPLVALAAAFMGILNARGKFFMPAFSSALFNMASIIVGVGCAKLFYTYGQSWGIQPIEGMAYGVLAGGLVQALSQLPLLYRTGYHWEPARPEDPVWHRDPHLRKMLLMMVPGTIGLAATQINILVNTVLATSQGTGAVSWLNYSFRLMQFPIGIFGVSLAAATLPKVSQLWVHKDVNGIRDTLTQSLKHVFAINLPASAGLAFLGYPIIELIFQYGRFYPEDTRATAMALAMYSVGLAAYSSVKVLVPACYAVGNTRVPVVSSALSVGLTICLNLVMIGPFGFWGLALGTSIAALFNATYLLFALRKILHAAEGNLPFQPIIKAFGQQLLLAMAMGIGCWFSYNALNTLLPDRILVDAFGRHAIPFSRGLKVTLLVIEGIIIVALLARIFRVRDTTDAIELFSRKFKKKLSRGQT
ncbi:MAG: murein biosynthesis integral membrane protein MurJ [Bdellovibrionales bacterium GWC1_52_8]|nr:MAG: murein biosynthesis integral membrane protein MurJ [Bdellovibrionales bacterium GWA1_52_35]OFZ41608.1 MAG: murein biosynthesis integral membrane protein MurJ [Bdellovibrionales bacterium GWC1_52_8]